MLLCEAFLLRRKSSDQVFPDTRANTPALICGTAKSHSGIQNCMDSMPEICNAFHQCENRINKKTRKSRHNAFKTHASSGRKR
jgi:hypothetical protein